METKDFVNLLAALKRLLDAASDDGTVNAYEGRVAEEAVKLAEVKLYAAHPELRP